MGGGRAADMWKKIFGASRNNTLTPQQLERQKHRQMAALQYKTFGPNKNLNDNQLNKKNKFLNIMSEQNANTIASRYNAIKVEQVEEDAYE